MMTMNDVKLNAIAEWLTIFEEQEDCFTKQEMIEQLREVLNFEKEANYGRVEYLR